MRFLVFIISLFWVFSFFKSDLCAQQHLSEKVSISGNLRPVYSWVETRQRNGDISDEHTMNARLQLALDYSISSSFDFRLRLASRYSNTTNTMKFVFRDYTSASGSYDAGTTTFDVIQLRWRLSADTELILGRFQGRFPLAGFIPKGMDRYYAANLSISHTDGIWVRQNLSTNWRTDIILSHNGKKGSSHAARNPLSFDEPASRFAGFVNVAHRNTGGFWVQRELSLSLYPKSFEKDDALQNLIVFTGRGMMRLPITVADGEVWLGGELGIIPNAPTSQAAGIPVANPLFDDAALSWQISTYLNDVFKKHRFGLLYGQTEPQWVVSSSFRPNNTMAEFRYRYTINTSLNFEFRYRLRTDLYKREGSEFTQRDNDIYARFTYRF